MSDPAGLKVVCAVTHRYQKTLGLALASLEGQSRGYARRRVFSGIAPASDSLNACLEFASDEDADILLHAAADVLLEPFALEHLLASMDMDRNYLAVGKVSDILNGVPGGIALTAFNMRAIGRSVRFSDTPGMMANLCEHVERLTGKTCTFVGAQRSLGYRQPIWTPIEMYITCRQEGAAYDKQVRAKLVSFLTEELVHNVSNKTLLCGMLGIEQARARFQSVGLEHSRTIEAEFLEASAHLCLDGSEYYVHHLRFKRLAQRLLGSYQDCVTIEER